MSFVSWVTDSLASKDVIDLYFIWSDLFDVEISDAEACETAYFDTLASNTARDGNGEHNIPIGKRVL